MPEEDQCECFPNLFRRSIQNLKFYNSPKFRKKRILFALQHTYSSNLKKIEHLIKSHAWQPQKNRHTHFPLRENVW